MWDIEKQIDPVESRKEKSRVEGSRFCPYRWRFFNTIAWQTTRERKIYCPPVFEVFRRQWASAPAMVTVIKVIVLCNYKNDNSLMRSLPNSGFGSWQGEYKCCQIGFYVADVFVWVPLFLQFLVFLRFFCVHPLCQRMCFSRKRGFCSLNWLERRKRAKCGILICTICCKSEIVTDFPR